MNKEIKGNSFLRWTSAILICVSLALTMLGWFGFDFNRLERNMGQFGYSVTSEMKTELRRNGLADETIDSIMSGTINFVQNGISYHDFAALSRIAAFTNTALLLFSIALSVFMTALLLTNLYAVFAHVNGKRASGTTGLALIVLLFLLNAALIIYLNSGRNFGGYYDIIDLSLFFITWPAIASLAAAVAARILWAFNVMIVKKRYNKALSEDKNRVVEANAQKVSESSPIENEIFGKPETDGITETADPERREQTPESELEAKAEVVLEKIDLEVDEALADMAQLHKDEREAENGEMPAETAEADTANESPAQIIHNQFCTECGALLEKGAQFCTKCGQKL